MSMKIEPGQETNLIRESSSSVMTRKEIEDKISSLKSEEIHAFAQNIVASVMNSLNIDVMTREVALYSGKSERYDPESRMIKDLTPEVEKLLQEAFSTPSQFFDKGVFVPFFTLNSTGLLDKVNDEYLASRLSIAKKNLIHKFDLNSITLDVHIKNSKDTKDELLFDRLKLLNGALVGHNCLSVGSCLSDLTTHHCF